MSRRRDYRDDEEDDEALVADLRRMMHSATRCETKDSRSRAYSSSGSSSSSSPPPAPRGDRNYRGDAGPSNPSSPAESRRPRSEAKRNDELVIEDFFEDEEAWEPRKEKPPVGCRSPPKSDTRSLACDTTRTRRPRDQRLRSIDSPAAIDRKDLESSESSDDGKVSKASSKPITLAEATDLRTLLIGGTRRPMAPSWREQGFVFSEDDDCGYGLVQHEGGPCGVLAAVQAHVLEELIYSQRERRWQNPSPSARSRALKKALGRILWRIGDGEVRFCSLSERAYVDRTASYSPDSITERVRVWRCSSLKELEQLIETQFASGVFTESRGPGLLLFLYSALLTRGLERVSGDMDVQAPLIEKNGYAKQEVVNLLMFGLAHSNVFNGEQRLSGGGDVTRLRGIPRRADLGFLTLFESYGHTAVGDFYKKPRRSIWLVYSESHYSTLFSLVDLFGDDEDGYSKKRSFDLHYWDGLANQDGLIRLSVDTTTYDRRGGKELPSADDPRALIPPLDLVIRTKWSTAGIDWNDTDPIL